MSCRTAWETASRWGAHNDGIGWHTDHGYKAEPVMCTMLYAIQVPPEGSDTLLADQCAAYAALPDDMRARIDDLEMIHSYEYLTTSREYGGKPLTPELKAANPDVIHPLIRTHPANGRKALWISGGTRGFCRLGPGRKLPPDRRTDRVRNPGPVRLSPHMAGSATCWSGTTAAPCIPARCSTTRGIFARCTGCGSRGIGRFRNLKTLVKVYKEHHSGIKTEC